jgi:hypothetical protein
MISTTDTDGFRGRFAVYISLITSALLWHLQPVVLLKRCFSKTWHGRNPMMPILRDPMATVRI